MKRLMIVGALSLTTAIGAALSAQMAAASSPLPMPRPAVADVSFDEAAPGLDARTVYVTAIDPNAPRSAGYGVNDSERVVFPVYFSEGWTTTSDEAETMLRAVAEEITYRGLRNIYVVASDAALTSTDMSVQRDAEDRVAAVASALQKFGVPERWIAMQPGAASDV
ncbi:hypothetical protein [Parvibaculum sp.]|jgi:hypothetical protein|uniref:hypothetical protein n=1 Tax=Parvibaculum sp. TaxID=2024848 RepID=UPI001B28E50B|nr:hypothetical protein [Parvibaculum sp.]MBO6633323.1 hypothetical protein [Parvibaculum sp.]MBO6678161.1 hypothetical protein [Parvibaculum sp.]MBO6683691.1 hypothetical protein [Parvibaculum sp.]MBO6906336.1 hypothetical protein [Parvibaculum sp.]